MGGYSTSDKLFKNRALQLYTWLEVSITWGPLIPALLPLLLLALVTNSLTFQIGIRWFQANPPAEYTSCTEAVCQLVLMRFVKIGFGATVAISFHMRVWSSHFLMTVPIFWVS